ncbi:MAG: hypothetical protein ACRDH8_14545 [Actinomycetota bacterium]
MKNFPHRYVDFPKIRATLALVAEMSSAGEDMRDDGTPGYALARHSVYRFRNFDYEAPDLQRRLEARIAEERRKPPGSQGARTAAREMRRTLQFLGWLDDEFQPTDTGQELLATEPGSDEERQALGVALLTGVLADEGTESHPGRILLRLVGEHGPFESRDGMELALEAQNDSEEEFQRISRLLSRSHADRTSSMGVTETQMANAVKILPSFALQAGLLAQGTGGGEFYITLEGSQALRASVEAGEIALSAAPPRHPPPRPAIRPETRRRVDPESVARRRTIAGAPRTLSSEEQVEAMRLRLERTDRHQTLVRGLARHGGDWEMFEDLLSFDLLMVPPDGPLVLWEAKTIDGDAAAQVRLAVGQLLFYEHFHVRSGWEGRELVRAAVFDGEIGEELAAFLEGLDIGAFTLEDGELRALNDTGRGILQLLLT